jgi:hypothetical protein
MGNKKSTQHFDSKPLFKSRCLEIVKRDERTILNWIFGIPSTPVQDRKVDCFLKV